MTVKLLNKVELSVSFSSFEMFLCLYTPGEGKSHCYVSLSLTFYWLRERYVAETTHLIVLVVSPLIGLS